MSSKRVFALAATVAGCLAFAGAAQASPGAPGVGDPYFPLEGNGGYDAQHYDLTFTTTRRPTGSRASRSSPRAPRRTCRASTSTCSSSTSTGVTVDRQRASFNRDGQELQITPAQRAPRGPDLRHHGPLRRRAADDRRLADRVRLALRLPAHRRRRVHGRRAQRGLDVVPGLRPPAGQGEVHVPRQRPEGLGVVANGALKYHGPARQVDSGSGTNRCRWLPTW